VTTKFVPRGTKSFIIPEGSDLLQSITVVAWNTSGESANSATTEVEDLYVPYVPRTVGVFILNRGSIELSNSSLSYYNIEENIMIPDFYKTVNGKGLGNSAEQILIYGSKIYITVYKSNRIVVLDEAGNEIKSITYGPAITNLQGPRCMTADEGKVYISYYDGHNLAILDTSSVAIDQSNPKMTGRFPEQVVVAGGKIYVAASGGMDYPYYGKRITVINKATLLQEESIDVISNPVSLAANSRGDVFVISMGDYGDIKSTLQKIDGKTGIVTEIGYATLFSLVNDKLYTINAPYGAANVEYKRYNALTGVVETENFITDGTRFTSISAFAVDPLSGKIYIADGENYTSTSTLYIFSPDGKKEKEIDTEGVDAHSFAFVVR
jgi:DNA-binding beta-propeller fold protein YncE